jgi:hypothetical protein
MVNVSVDRDMRELIVLLNHVWIIAMETVFA